MLSYIFMQRALMIALFLGVAIPCVGQILVLRKFSMLGDALSHTALAGVCIGLIVGISPTISAIILCAIASLLVSIISKKMKHNEEIAIAIMMSLGVGIAAILSGFVKSSVNLTSFLFGSIISITNTELYLIAGMSLIIIGIFVKYYYEFMFYSFNETEANRQNLNIKKIDILFSVLVGITISISARIVGALIISSLLVIPIACSLQLSKSYKNTMVLAIIFSVFFMVGGLILSYYLGLRPGGTIILLSCFILLLILLIKAIRKKT